MKFKLSKYIHTCRDDDTLPDRFFLYATRTGAAVEIDNKYFEPLTKEEWGVLPTNILDNLLSVEAIVPQDEDELMYLLHQNKENIRDNDKKFLSYTIQPTANCQLGCHYCGQQHTKLVSDTSTNKAICDRIIGKMEELKGTLQTLSISWYGGEPLTGLSSIYEMSEMLIRYCKENDIRYTASMVTNGLSLKKSTYERLVSDYKVTGYQITLDGTAEFHDLRRMLKTGGPSFDIIFSNLKEILHSDFFAQNGTVISIRCNVDAQNKENVFELMDRLHENDMLDKVSFNTAPIHDWGDNKATQVNGITREDYAMFEIDVMLKLRELGALGDDGGIIPLRKYNVCMVANQTSEVFDALGNVSTCWEVPYTPMYDNSDFYSGNILKQDNVSTADAPMRKWYDEIPSNNSWCKSCKFLPVCGGSCPKHWYNNTVACPSFKQNIDERLFLSKLIKAESSSN